MKRILLFGAGKSATYLIDYLLNTAENQGWKLVVADANLQLAQQKIGSSLAGEAISLNIMDDHIRAEQIRLADIVISMLPPHLHMKVALDCLAIARHLLTASYVDDEMKKLADLIKGKNLLFLCETGLDPGIDHMSAMQLIDNIHSKGGKITSFQSHCGGLVAPESDTNPWHYKISWNSRNIILAGKAGAHYKKDGTEVQINHEQLFTDANRVHIPGIEQLSWYPNRDSLSYADLYGLQDAKTFIRTTLRHPDFMVGWRKIIELGLTNENVLYKSKGQTTASVFKQHLKKCQLEPLWEELYLNDEKKLLSFLELDTSPYPVNKEECSAADILQVIAEKKFSLRSDDRDMIVMLHQIEYADGKRFSQVESSLVVKGEDSIHTAMAKTVGLPLGIAAKLILQNKILLRGLHIPTHKTVYDPILDELKEHGVTFQELRD